MEDQDLISLAVSAELAHAFEVHAHLLSPARIRRVERDGPQRYLYWMDAPQAPPGACAMTPVFHQAQGGTAVLAHIDWYDADGDLLDTTHHGHH